MTQPEFLTLLAQAYDFPEYYGHNLDATDECLADHLENAPGDRLSPLPFFAALLADTPEEERAPLLELLSDYFEPVSEEEE